jgi:hypothetical protein
VELVLFFHCRVSFWSSQALKVLMIDRSLKIARLGCEGW